MVLLAAAYLSPVFFFIPKSALSAVIFLAAISMFDYEGAIHIYRIRKLDMVPLLVTFFLSFYEVAIGIGAGVAVSLIIMLFSHARPKIHITRRGSGKGAVVKSEQNVDYPACDYLDDKINASRFAGQEFLVIDMSNITKLDSGAAEQFAMFVKTKNCETGKAIDVYFTSARPVVRKALIRAEASIEHTIHGLSTGSLLAKLNYFDSKEERKEQARVDREEQELSDEDLGNRLFDARIEPELSQEQSEDQEKPAPPAESDNLMSGDKNV
jgi:MFS superfamily sulfate permease-like transporter